MDYTQPLSHHYRPPHGWVNDPNGLVYYKGYYHVFFQHTPYSERPDKPMHWGHARTRDFLTYEELPVALAPDMPYDRDGCWSGTAIVRDDRLYLFYAAVRKEEGKSDPIQTVAVAYSDDGVHFEKYAGNPVIATYPADGGPDFRDPAVALIDGVYYCVMASGHRETRAARLLLYRGEDMLHWDYIGVMCEWPSCRFAECPSFMPAEDGKYLLAASVAPLEGKLYFSVMYGDFVNNRFTYSIRERVDHGPDRYAGQVFRDARGRNILMTWIPGWAYVGYAERDVGCMSLPRELTYKNGRVYGYPVEEVRHLLTDSDPALTRTVDGFEIVRAGRAPVLHRGELRDLKMYRDGYVLEVFVNGGEDIYTVLL